MRRSVLVTATVLLAATSLAACGDDDSADGAAPAATPTTSSPAPTPSASTSPRPTKDIAVTLEGSRVSPPPGKVEVDEGTRVNVTVTRDTDGEIHVHGFELDKEAKAGVPTTLSFVADQTGVFEVEAHDPDRLLLQLEVR